MSTKTDLLRLAAELDDITASTKVAMYEASIYKQMEEAHGKIKAFYPEASDDAILGVVGPWYAGKLFSNNIPKTPFASDKQKQLLRILTGRG